MNLHPYCFSYIVFDKTNLKILDFEATVWQQPSDKYLSMDCLSNWFETHSDTFGLHFIKSKVSIHSPEFTVFPTYTEKPNEIFELLGGSELKDASILSTKINDTFYVYSTIENKTKQFIESQLPNVEFYTIDTGLLYFFNNKLNFKNYLVGNLYGDELSICLKKENEIHYYNTFTIKAKEDLLYYLRWCYEEFSLDLNEFPTYLYGFIEEKSPLYSTTYGFIRNFEIDRTLKHSLPFTYSFEEIPLHYYINLLGIYNPE